MLGHLFANQVQHLFLLCVFATSTFFRPMGPSPMGPTATATPAWRTCAPRPSGAGGATGHAPARRRCPPPQSEERGGASWSGEGLANEITDVVRACASDELQLPRSCQCDTPRPRVDSHCCAVTHSATDMEQRTPGASLRMLRVDLSWLLVMCSCCRWSLG